VKDTVRLGRVLGIPLGVNWSLVVVAGLLAYALAGRRLPAQAPGYRPGLYAIAGVLTALGLFVTVLAHELGHAVVARRYRLPVDGITLSWIGGITRIDAEAATARSEALLAAAGPGVSLAVGGVLFVIQQGVDAAGGGRLVHESLGWLAVINVLLGVFNLIPAAPLDGGRILHALTWGVTHDRWRAGKLASAAGMGLGAAVVLLGGWQVASSRSTGATVDAFLVGLVGWWLISVARGERRLASIHGVLEGCRCADVMRPVLGGPGWVTVEAFLAGVPAGAHAPAPVWMLEDWGAPGITTGVITTEALQMVPPPLRASTRPVDVAVPVGRAAGARPSDDLLDTLGASGGSAMILVVDGDRTVGAIVPADIEAIVGQGRPVARARPARSSAPVP
jgi:Zn-dependent protease